MTSTNDHLMECWVQPIVNDAHKGKKSLSLKELVLLLVYLSTVQKMYGVVEGYVLISLSRKVKVTICP